MSFAVKLISTLVVITCISASNAEPHSPTLIGLDLYQGFYSAIEMDSFMEIKQFVDFGVDINHQYAGGKTPLMIATLMGSARSLRTLLELGANVEIKSAEGKTALDYAKIKGDKFIVSMLKANPGQDHSLITEIQYYLKKLGYTPGPIDGLLGNKTIKALKRFAKRTQQANPAEISYKQLEILKTNYFAAR